MIDVCRQEELSPGGRVVVDVGLRSIGVFNIDGRLYALPNTCTHQLGPLCRGTISGTMKARAETGYAPEWVHEGEILTCPWHGLEFHIPSGQSIAYPGKRLRTYEVVVEDGMVRVRT